MALAGRALVFSNFLQPLHLLHLVGQLNFLGGSEQRHPADIAEVPTDGIGAEAAAPTVAGAANARTDLGLFPLGPGPLRCSHHPGLLKI